MAKHTVDMSGIEVSGRYLSKSHPFNPHGVSVYRVSITTRHYHDIAESAEGQANVLASKNGWKMLEGVHVHPITQSTWDNQYSTARDYTMRLPKPR